METNTADKVNYKSNLDRTSTRSRLQQQKEPKEDEEEEQQQQKNNILSLRPPTPPPRKPRRALPPEDHHRQIGTTLEQWQPKRIVTTRYLQQKSQDNNNRSMIHHSNKIYAPFPLNMDEYDRNTEEEDLVNQLQRLRLPIITKEIDDDEDGKQYQSLKKSLEEQLKSVDSHQLTHDLPRNYINQMQHIKALLLSEVEEQQQQYNIIMKTLAECEQEEQQQQLDTIKQLENDKQSSMRV